MSNIRSELQKKAQSAIMQYAFFRWESAVIIAGTILLMALLPHPFPWWPVWGWLILGLVGLAALSNVPAEIYEAAALDGATGWRRLRHITVPMISPTLFFLLIVATIRAFRVFGHIYVLAAKDTERTAHNVTMFIFRTFYESGETGYGSAIALVLFAIILLVTLVQMRVVGQRVHYQ